MQYIDDSLGIIKKDKVDSWGRGRKVARDGVEEEKHPIGGEVLLKSIITINN